jgi:hypothetical protein
MHRRASASVGPFCASLTKLAPRKGPAWHSGKPRHLSYSAGAFFLEPRRLRSAPFWCSLSARVSGLDVLEKQRCLFVMVAGDEIIVTSEMGFRAAYCRRPHHPQLIVRRRASEASRWATPDGCGQELTGSSQYLSMPAPCRHRS